MTPPQEPRAVSFSPWQRKPLSVVYQQERQSNSSTIHHHLPRQLTVWDLLGIGVGGTVGSGIFVLMGDIAAHQAGRFVWMSFALAGVAATLSGLCFAELAARLPADGSTFVYSQVCWGQLAAVIAAACLTLEYGIAGAAVARTWGDKLLWMMGGDDDAAEITSESESNTTTNHAWLQPLSLPACALSAACTALLYSGVRESKRVTNAMTILKMMLVAFMIVGGFVLSWTKPYHHHHHHNRALSRIGSVSGVLRGATRSFFGYLGYDEVCCLAGEAQHPVRDMPRAVLGTLATVTLTYVAASLALVGMVDDVSQISPTSGFPSAFRANQVEWAAQVATWGEVITLPVVVLISLLAQPRLMYSMTQDGLLPEIFMRMDHKGNLTTATLISGTVMTVIATCVPFTYLDDLISAGILVAFCLTNSSLVLLRRESPIHRTGSLETCLLIYNALCLVSALLWTRVHMFPGQSVVAMILTLATMACLFYMVVYCPPARHFGGSVLQLDSNWHGYHGNRSLPNENEYFHTPGVPFVPCLGMALNWYLIAQLETIGLWLLILYLGAAVLCYVVYGVIRGSSMQRVVSYHALDTVDDSDVLNKADDASDADFEGNKDSTIGLSMHGQ